MPTAKKIGGRSTSSKGTSLRNPAAGRSTKHSAGSGKRAPSDAVKADINELAATQPLATVKARLSEFIERVHTYRERIVITRNGVPVAVLIDPDELFSLEETLDLMNDPEAMEALAEGESGEVMSSEEFVARMESKLGPRR